MTKAKHSHKVSSREDKARALNMVRELVAAKKIPNESFIQKTTGVSRAYSRMVEAGLITIDKAGAPHIATSWGNTEIIDSLWTKHGKSPQAPPTNGTLEFPGQPVAQSNGLQIPTVTIHAHAGLIERINAALKMVEDYQIENRGKFIATYLIQTNPVT